MHCTVLKKSNVCVCVFTWLTHIQVHTFLLRWMSWSNLSDSTFYTRGGNAEESCWARGANVINEVLSLYRDTLTQSWSPPESQEACWDTEHAGLQSSPPLCSKWASAAGMWIVHVVLESLCVPQTKSFSQHNIIFFSNSRTGEGTNIFQYNALIHLGVITCFFCCWDICFLSLVYFVCCSFFLFSAVLLHRFHFFFFLSGLSHLLSPLWCEK